MRQFFWNCFAVTGSVDAYLLYKDAEALANDSAEERPDDRDEEVETLGRTQRMLIKTEGVVIRTRDFGESH